MSAVHFASTTESLNDPLDNIDDEGAAAMVRRKSNKRTVWKITCNEFCQDVGVKDEPLLAVADDDHAIEDEDVRGIRGIS